MAERDYVTVDLGADAPATLTGIDLHAYIGQLEKRMREAAGNLEFEEAARLRDEIRKLEDKELGLATGAPEPGRRAPAAPSGSPPPARATTSAARRRPSPSRAAGPGLSWMTAAPRINL